MSTDFLWGVVAGVIFVAAISPFIRIYQNWVKQMRAADKKQVVMHFTDKTPAEVWYQSVRATIRITIFWVLVSAIAVLLYAYFFAPEMWEFIKQMVQVLYEEIDNGQP